MQSICLCVSSNEKYMHNPMFYIIERKICKFKICSIFSIVMCRSVLIVVFLMQVLCHVLCTRMKVW